jgi:hypothetical protein
MSEPEFTFELRVCQWAEREWPPEGTLSDDRVALVAGQLGVRERRWDTLIVECDADALAARAVFGDERLDSDLLHVIRNAPDEWAYYRDALPDPGYPWRYVREAVHDAADRDAVETRRAGNRIEIRRRWHYPDWVERIVAVENKPDLDAAAADALADQLERDVALGLADEVWVATRATGDRIEPALFEDLPVEAGILAFDDGAADGGGGTDPDAAPGAAREGGERASVVWRPSALAVDEPGTRIRERPEGATATGDRSAARFEYADPDWKRDKRLEIAERAYERGWRAYADTMRTDCRHFRLRRHDGDVLPWCGAKRRGPTGRECSGSCPEFAPEPPAWRTRGWPIEGGPGKGFERLLARRRERVRRP